jgi:hypothetical protein
MGQAKPFGVERGVRRADFDCADFLLLRFIREDGTPRLSFCFAAMAAFYANCGVPMTQASIAA